MNVVVCCNPVLPLPPHLTSQPTNEHTKQKVRLLLLGLWTFSIITIVTLFGVIHGL